MTEKRFEIIQGDCLDVLPKLEKESIDLIITDPPYLMNYHTGHRLNKNHDFCKPIMNDNNPSVISEVIPLLFDVLKDGGALYMFCNSNHIDFFKQEIEKHFKVKNILIWIKNNWSAGDLKGAYAKKTEFIIFAVKGRHLLNGGRDTDTLYYDRVVGNMQLHQNQKPVDLINFLINKSSQTEDTVLDGFMGSGTTGVACMETNRNFIGIELDENYYNIAKQRIQEAKEQRKLI